jgi:ADP-ribose pyrophosphatase YjhB (NUDIX family)
MTLVYLRRPGMLCLAMKKRGFGAGNWNGYGGKLEAGESVRDAAVREVREESGVIVLARDLEEVARIDFIFKDGKELEVHAFLVDRFEGEPEETEEMRPEWYTFDAIPYEKMWADDPHWLPRALRGEKLRGAVHFDTDGATIVSMSWEKVESL